SSIHSSSPNYLYLSYAADDPNYLQEQRLREGLLSVGVVPVARRPIQPTACRGLRRTVVVLDEPPPPPGVLRLDDPPEAALVGPGGEAGEPGGHLPLDPGAPLVQVAHVAPRPLGPLAVGGERPEPPLPPPAGADQRPLLVPLPRHRPRSELPARRELDPGP